VGGGFLSFKDLVDHYSISDDFFYFYSPITPIPVAARCKTWLCGRSLAGIVGSNHAGGRDGWMDASLL